MPGIMFVVNIFMKHTFIIFKALLCPKIVVTKLQMLSGMSESKTVNGGFIYYLPGSVFLIKFERVVKGLVVAMLILSDCSLFITSG